MAVPRRWTGGGLVAGPGPPAPVTTVCNSGSEGDGMHHSVFSLVDPPFFQIAAPTPAPSTFLPVW